LLEQEVGPVVPLTLESALQQLRDGSLTSTALVTQLIEHADELDGRLGVYVSRFDEAALAAASRADEAARNGEYLGLLHGIPLGIKDLIASREGPTTAQSRALEPDWWRPGDAPAVASLREAGAIILGKTTTMEFAYGVPSRDDPFPLPANPWDPSRWAGGSSSGTASGIAAAMILGGLGTDTAGSVRVPAAMCGVTGLMPTFGSIPTAGVVPVGFTADRVGPLAHTARGCSLIFEVLSGQPVARRESSSLEGLRIGVDRLARTKSAGGDAALDGLLDAALATLEQLGARVIELELPLYDKVTDAVFLTTECEAFAYHAPRLAARWEDYGRSVRLGLARGAYYSAADYLQAQRVRRQGQELLAGVFANVDLVVSPTASIVAPLLDEIGTCMGSWKQLVHTTYWDAVTNPVVSVPIGFSSDGLPLGMQIAGRPFDDHLVLAAGEAFQHVTDWHLQSPDLIDAKESNEIQRAGA
jgi:aspartyl-tRNA(Asn)/glutamyl-tRNA(Gln) amidotransferase subunit A